MIEYGTTFFDEDLGFPGVCNAPCFSVASDYEVWAPDDPGNPLPEPGNNTYVYSLTQEGGEGPFVPAVFEFEVAVDSDFVTDAGVLDSSGVEPSSMTIYEDTNAVSWEFLVDIIDAGEFTQSLFVHSPLTPGFVGASLSGQGGLTAVSQTVGPLTVDPDMVVPEPSTAILLFAGILTIAAYRKVKKCSD
jgi:hypothetical protein